MYHFTKIAALKVVQFSVSGGFATLEKNEHGRLEGVGTSLRTRSRRRRVGGRKSAQMAAKRAKMLSLLGRIPQPTYLAWPLPGATNAAKLRVVRMSGGSNQIARKGLGKENAKADF
jgi:hypothetical protein